MCVTGQTVRALKTRDKRYQRTGKADIHLTTNCILCFALFARNNIYTIWVSNPGTDPSNNSKGLFQILLKSLEKTTETHKTNKKTISDHKTENIKLQIKSSKTVF